MTEVGTRRLSRLDFDDLAFVADPYPSFHAERARGPVSWHEPSETWLVVDHAACSQALRDRTARADLARPAAE